MVDTNESILQLTDALKRRSVCKKIIEEVVTNILMHKVDLIYWNDVDKERIVLHAYLLARTRSLLQESLATDLNLDGQEIIKQYINGINEHFSMYQWPTEISEDDPVLLKQLWDQQNICIPAKSQHLDNYTDADHISAIRSERNRILRILLKFPAIVSPLGEFEPVETCDLVTALQKQQSNRFTKAVIEKELQARYPAAYNFLAAVYGLRYVTKLDRFLDLKKMSSEGYLQSIIQSIGDIRVLVDNLTIAHKVLGEQNFLDITGSWDTLNQIRLVAVLVLHSK
jgi:hypothetical protein